MQRGGKMKKCCKTYKYYFRNTTGICYCPICGSPLIEKEHFKPEKCECEKPMFGTNHSPAGVTILCGNCGREPIKPKSPLKNPPKKLWKMDFDYKHSGMGEIVFKLNEIIDYINDRYNEGEK